MPKKIYSNAKAKIPEVPVPVEPEKIDTAWFLFDQTSASRSRLKPGVAAAFHGLLSLLAREWDAVAAAYTAATPDTALRVHGQKQYAKNVASGLRNAKARIIESFPTYDLIEHQTRAEEEIAELVNRRRRKPKDDSVTPLVVPESEVV